MWGDSEMISPLQVQKYGRLSMNSLSRAWAIFQFLNISGALLLVDKH